MNAREGMCQACPDCGGGGEVFLPSAASLSMIYIGTVLLAIAQYRALLRSTYYWYGLGGTTGMISSPSRCVLISTQIVLAWRQGSHPGCLGDPSCLVDTRYVWLCDMSNVTVYIREMKPADGDGHWTGPDRNGTNKGGWQSV